MSLPVSYYTDPVTSEQFLAQLDADVQKVKLAHRRAEYAREVSLLHAPPASHTFDRWVARRYPEES